MEIEERAQVNQRALIDKVLARYSGEFTLFRELLQNADDAGSPNAEIRFETAAYQKRPQSEDNAASPPPAVSASDLTKKVVQWTFRNDGKQFDAGDWKRLPRIAEGNPNPDKIGAFGVGFYSVFSVTDSPCVSSGDIELQFYWKEDDNQLYTRRQTHPRTDPWTTFKMPLREPNPFSSAAELMRFLASSITFMEKLDSVSVFFDGDRIGRVTKSRGPSQAIDIPSGIKRSSPEQIMDVKSVQSQRVQINAEISSVVFPSSVKEASAKSRVDLTIFTAEVDVKADEKLLKELFRCMKKNPPSPLKYSLIYTGKEDYDRNSEERKNYLPEVGSIFEGLYADLEEAKHTRIFIGHATGQTTSIGGHMASRFIPTVERESIDFVDKYVSAWNKELLYVGGFSCRVVYELELTNIQNSWTAVQSPPTRDGLHDRFLHLLRFFAFHDSSPSQKVAGILHESFYSCSASPLRLLSSIGVREAPSIRLFDSQVAKFLDSIPMLSVARNASRHINRLPKECKIASVTVKDVLQALDGRPLSEQKLTSCLRWWLELERNGTSNSRATDLLDAVTFNGAGGTPRPLSQTVHFINTGGLGAHIPRDGPLPGSLLPYSVSRNFNPTDLMKFEWKELSVIDWFQHISQKDVMSRDLEHDFTRSPEWARRVLYTLSRAWSSLSDMPRSIVKTTFQETQCIPTSRGLCRPADSFLPIADDVLLHKFDLAVVSFASELDGDMVVLLTSIGTKTHIPLDLLSNQMLHTGKWRIFDLIRYLVRQTVTSQELSTLKSSLFDDDTGGQCYVHQLYPPVQVFRQLRLPVIMWDKSKWSDESEEAKLLYRLGLHRYPPLEEIIKLCASPEISVGETAFKYFCENLRSKYSEYNPRSYQDVIFVPAENREGNCLKAPGDVFLGMQWKPLGFSIVRSTFQKAVIGEVGIRQDPPPSQLLELLEREPPCYEDARGWYECLSDCTQTFTQSELAKLSKLKIVPRSSSNPQEWLTPTECYLGPPTNEFYSKLFVFVDFGNKANNFLSACGSMKEPSAKDVAERLIHNPDKFYELAATPESFLEKLRDLATRKAYIPNDTLHRMSRERTLLGKRRERASDTEDWKSIWELQTPKAIVIVDDPRDYELFGDVVHVAPQDELLERFYRELGCRQLSTVIQERYENSPAIEDSKAFSQCSKVQHLILQRLPSFLQKCSHYQYDQTRVPKKDNFRVIVCERLLVRKTLIIGDDKDTQAREQDLWAVAKCNEEKHIELWLSRHTKQDIYDLAASLCRILFGRVKFTDTVLLGAMLSDLELLKRAGFDVDQFENQPDESNEDASVKGNAETDGPSSGLPGGQSSSAQTALNYLQGSIAKTLDSARAYLTAKPKSSSTPYPSNISECKDVLHRLIPQPRIRGLVGEVTKACGSGTNRLPKNKEEEEIVQFLRRYSCVDFADIDNLQRIGVTPEGIEILVAGGAPEICAFIAGKQELLARFIRIIELPASAHKLPRSSLHIFYDANTGPIAFNLEGAIYLNLRYFEVWHDEDVKIGGPRRAQLSWFFVLAHEMAHSLIPAHDSAHEFWFAAICEDHIDDLRTNLRCGQ